MCVTLDTCGAEASAASPKNIYGWSKLAAEGLVQLHAGRHVAAHVAALRVQQRFTLVNLGNVVAVRRDDVAALGDAARGAAVLLQRYGDDVQRLLDARQWRLPARVDRVYDVALAMRVLDWAPVDTPGEICRRLLAREPVVW